MLTDSPRVRATRKQMLELDHAQPPGRLRHLRQVRRVHAAGLPLRSTTARRPVSRDVPRCARPSTTSSPSASSSTTSAASCARAASRFTREISKTDVARHPEPRRPLARARGGGRRVRARPVLRQRDRHLPGRRAPVARHSCYKARVWYLEADAVRSARAASAAAASSIWHRKSEWKLNALDPAANARIDRVTPLDNPAVNGPWICNSGRDLAQVFERPRAAARC